MDSDWIVCAAIWSSDNEQRAVPVSVLGPCICPRTDVGLLFRSVGDPHSLHHHGSVWQFPYNLPSLDISSGYPTLPLVSGIGLCSWLCVWLVLGLGQPMFLALVVKPQQLLGIFCCCSVHRQTIVVAFCLVGDSHIWLWDPQPLMISIENVRACLIWIFFVFIFTEHKNRFENTFGWV